MTLVELLFNCWRSIRFYNIGNSTADWLAKEGALAPNTFVTYDSPPLGLNKDIFLADAQALVSWVLISFLF